MGIRHHPSNPSHSQFTLLPSGEIQKYPPLYHRTTEQLCSSGCETPQFIINTQFCKKKKKKKKEDSLGFYFSHCSKKWLILLCCVVIMLNKHNFTLNLDGDCDCGTELYWTDARLTLKRPLTNVLIMSCLQLWGFLYHEHCNDKSEVRFSGRIEAADVLGHLLKDTPAGWMFPIYRALLFLSGLFISLACQNTNVRFFFHPVKRVKVNLCIH